jgi:TolB-like protein
MLQTTDGDRVSEKRVVRRLAALLVADAVGYSGRMREDETATHHLVMADLASLLAPSVREHGGRVVKTTGDGLLAEFSSVVDCVQCALQIQEAVAGRPSAGPEERRLLYRIGINLGDIIVEPDDIYGDGVNVAVRLQGLAEPGGILLSGDAYRHVRGKLSAGFEDLGDQVVKGFTEPVRAYRVLMAGVPASGQRDAAATLRSLGPAMPSIIVLPFDNLSGDLSQGYFSDGITNDIITDLSKYSELFVIASHTSFTYKGKHVKVQDIGRELGVRYLVEGSVQRAEDRVRINAQLIEASSGRHLWAERYDRPMQDVFRLQDEIVQTIVGTLVGQVSRSEGRRALHSRTDSLEAYDIYLRGRAAWHDWRKESNRKAEELFAKAIELDPTFAHAYGYLAYTLLQGSLVGWERSPEKLQRACELAQKAVTLAPSDSDNYWSLAGAYVYSREFDKGMAAFARAVELNPNNPNLLVDMADALVFVGRPEEAIVHIERAMRLNPIHPDFYLWSLGIALYYAGRYAESVAALTRMSDPPNLVRRHLAANYVRLGRLVEARRVAAEFLIQQPAYTLEQEKARPFRDPSVLEAFIADLQRAGLPKGSDERGEKSRSNG